MTMRCAFLSGTLSLLLSASPASAQTRADRRAAERLLRAGQDLYARGEYLDAAGSFHAAYEKVPDPSFLFNEARAYERGNALHRAIEAYEAYLSAAPDADDVVDVERKIAVLRARLRAREGEEEPGTGTSTAAAAGTDGEAGEETQPAPESTAPPKRDFHRHAFAAFLAPVVWVNGAEDKVRLGIEYRFGLDERSALAGQLMLVYPLYAGRSASTDGFGIAAFWVHRLPLFDPFDLFLRAGLAFERLTNRYTTAHLVALRGGAGIVYHLASGFALQVEALPSPSVYFSSSETISAGSDTDFIFTVEAMVSVVMGL